MQLKSSRYINSWFKENPFKLLFSEMLNFSSAMLLIWFISWVKSLFLYNNLYKIVYNGGSKMVQWVMACALPQNHMAEGEKRFL